MFHSKSKSAFENDFVARGMSQKKTEVGVGRVGPRGRSELGCRTKKSRAGSRPPRQKKKRSGDGFL